MVCPSNRPNKEGEGRGGWSSQAIGAGSQTGQQDRRREHQRTRHEEGQEKTGTPGSCGDVRRRK